MENSDSDFDPTMAASVVFENVINQVKLSNLNFRMELTPFSASILLKKSLIKDRSGYHLQPPIQRIRPANHSTTLEDDLKEQLQRLKQNFEMLDAKNKSLEVSNKTIKEDLENALIDNDSNCKIISDMKNTLDICDSTAAENVHKIKQLERDLADAVRNSSDCKQKLKLADGDSEHKVNVKDKDCGGKDINRALESAGHSEEEVEVDTNYNVKVFNFFSPISDHPMDSAPCLNSKKIQSTPPPLQCPKPPNPSYTPPGSPPKQVTALDDDNNNSTDDFMKKLDDFWKQQYKINDELWKKMSDKWK